MNIQTCLTAVVTCLMFCSASMAEQRNPIEVPQSTITTSSSSILLVADPQIHNIYGMELKQMLGISDVVSKVAIRPPELNILAPLILTHLVKEATEKDTPRAIILLGDATNIACSGEHDLFDKSLAAARPDGVPLLLAHGNHDSYLMGTANSYIPKNNLPDWPPSGMAESREPVDMGWWGKSTEIHSRHRRNWRDACFQPNAVGQERSSPMNKSRWIAKYLAALKVDGLVKAPMSTTSTQRNTDKFALAYTAESGSLLAKYKFQASGFWFPPIFGNIPSSKKTDLMRVSKSFIVQSVDFDDSRIIIIDTSVCGKARGGLTNFIKTNAGQHACIGEDQFEIIERYVPKPEDFSNRRLVIAGHFPLGDLNPEERNRLISIASKHKGWIYFSAHSHISYSEKPWQDGLEINVGSTTDWPMEVNSVRFNSGQSKPIVSTTFNNFQENFHYSEPQTLRKTEVCRHLPSAKFLAEFQIDKIPDSYISHVDANCAVKNEVSWNTKGNELYGYVQIINDRFNKNPAYKQFLLNIAGAASKSESEKSDWSSLIH